MKTLLPVIICLFAVSGVYAQIKGDPQMKGKLQQLNVSKSSSKLSPELNRLHEKYGPAPQATQLVKGQIPPSDALENLMQIRGDKVLVDFTVKDDVNAAKAELQKAGVIVTASFGRVISGYVPINALPQIEATTTIRYARASYKPLHAPVKANNLSKQNIRHPLPPGTSVTGIVSQGDTAQLSYLARQKYHVNGKGVKVGAMSDSYNNWGAAGIGVKHGELPGRDNPFGFKTPVQVLKDLDSGGIDEGRQMLEIVHDVAPGSSLAFRTAEYGQADFAQGIQDLADAGCKIICDDIIYFDEPFFQDGIIAQSVDLAKKRGVTVFSAAGNEGRRSYESDYRPSDFEPFGPVYGTAHNFSAPGDSPRYSEPLYLPPGGTMFMVFQWSAPSFAAGGIGCPSDFDIYLTDVNGNLVSGSGADNIATGEPYEAFEYINTTTDSTFFLTIVKYAGPDPVRLKYVFHTYDSKFYITTPPIPGTLAGSLIGHPKAEGDIAVGAIFYGNTPPYGIGLDTALVEYFSSVGGVANYLDIDGNNIPPLVRKNPDIVAPNGGNVSWDPLGAGADIPEDSDTLPNFFGTSAAAPHAAGVAALMIEAQKLNTITPDQIKGVLEETAGDLDDYYALALGLPFTTGFDYNTGYGLVNAEKAVGRVKFPTLYVQDLKLAPLCSDNPGLVRNWKITNPNLFSVDAEWHVAGTNQHGTISVAPGDTSFATNTVTYNNVPVPNEAIISWKDNFDFTRVYAAFSTRANCSTDEVSDDNSDKLISSSAVAGKENITITNLAEVYPNPSSATFRLYLSLAEKLPTNIELFSIDGKKLQSQTIEQSNGVFDIDATGYRPGIYLLLVKQGNFVKTIKLVKE
jgi:subtilase family protein/type IX secretion system substrate protein